MGTLVDDIQRTGGFGGLTATQQADYDAAYLDARERHETRVRTLVIATLAGDIDSCIGWIQRPGEAARTEVMDCSDLLDVMGVTDRPGLIAKLFAAAFDFDSRGNGFGEAEDILADYVAKTADLLAKRDAIREVA